MRYAGTLMGTIQNRLHLISGFNSKVIITKLSRLPHTNLQLANWTRLIPFLFKVFNQNLIYELSLARDLVYVKHIIKNKCE